MQHNNSIEDLVEDNTPLDSRAYFDGSVSHRSTQIKGEQDHRDSEDTIGKGGKSVQTLTGEATVNDFHVMLPFMKQYI
ncbi:hypothetical protein KDH_60320 [Dictyobacter sp. S3.2.2.5]|uniref:Uncharacterized protein n=1 Tax=Dictyobacter halimunensis TaxID=3026934 RepID=A0ABQ6FY46_9CHLR|nr:hypothetical protein KDH_60320 [Dictyobacter sp. S3.2.2.5]